MPTVRLASKIEPADRDQNFVTALPPLITWLASQNPTTADAAFKRRARLKENAKSGTATERTPKMQRTLATPAVTPRAFSSCGQVRSGQVYNTVYYFSAQI
jgi:hypothetical protein